MPFEAVVPVEFKGLGGSGSASAGTARSSSSAAPQSERKEQGRQEEGDEHEEEQEEEEPPPADWFRIGPHVFDADKHTALFAFPITSHPQSRKSSSSSGANGANAAASALAVCITANSAAGYLHASRLAWPTVPPMVRAPFANYLPDFVVVDESVWAEGFGGVALAGYWDTWWRFDSTQAFVK